jgi:hypothetical protein
VVRKDRRCTTTNSGEFATPNREARFLAVQKVVTSIASPSLMTRGGVMRDYSASLAPQAVVVYDAFSQLLPKRLHDNDLAVVRVLTADLPVSSQKISP